jgi:hypothetical protein
VAQPGDDDDTDLVIEFDLTCQCFGCGCEREPDGELVMAGERTTVAQAKNPCECGERRLRVTWSLEAP